MLELGYARASRVACCMGTELLEIHPVMALDYLSAVINRLELRVSSKRLYKLRFYCLRINLQLQFGLHGLP